MGGLGSLKGTLLAALFGYLLEWAFFSYLYQRDHLQQVLLTYGLILVFEELRSLIWGDDVHSVAVPDVFSASIPLTETLSYPVYRLWISAVCIVLAVLLFAFGLVSEQIAALRFTERK